jgi:hypothetical protein
VDLVAVAALALAALQTQAVEVAEEMALVVLELLSSGMQYK